MAFHHYRDLIRDREILPLRSQEHTAQLGTEELAKRENRFRQGKINLLSCSTTLEMGVDIGEFQAVALRNFPPHVSNYQQRAGRAGRRTDGVAVTLMYGQRRPHDRYYFERPEQLIDGENQVPKLDPTNFAIQNRHIRAELLALFLRTECGTGAEKIEMAEFLGLPEDMTLQSEASQQALLVSFTEWLLQPETKTFAQQWLTQLKSQKSSAQVLQHFSEDLGTFQQEQLRDWNSLSLELEALNRSVQEEGQRRKRNALERNRNRVEEELEKIKERQLHEELAKAGILPIYGFPIDVVQLLTRESQSYSRGQGRHRLQRDRRLALGEYAPGQSVVVDDQVHKSVGVLRPDRLPSRFYWVCKSCNFFTAASTKKDLLAQLETEEGDSKCPVCVTERTTKPLHYKIPKSFITDWDEQPTVTPRRKPTRQPTSQVFLAQEGNLSEPTHHRFFELIASQGGQFFLANQGGRKQQGFLLCERCGRDLTELRNNRSSKKTARSNSAQSEFKPIPHNSPISGRPCEGWHKPTHLGHEFRSDLLKIRFTAATNPHSLYGSVTHFNNGKEVLSDADSDDSSVNPVDGGAFWRSLTYALLAAAAQVIDVPRSEVDGLFRPLTQNHDKIAEIIIYDNVPGGAGYSRRIAKQFPEILQCAYQMVNSCSCSSSCYDCLRTYTNQLFHYELDRHLVLDFLQPIEKELSASN